MIARKLGLLAVSLSISLPAFAQPDVYTDGSCAKPITNIQAFVSEINALVGGTSTRAKYGSLGECLDTKSAAAHVESLGDAKRKQLTGQLLTALADPSLTDKQTRANAYALLTELARKGLDGFGPLAGSSYYFDALVEAATLENDPVLRRQAVLNIDSLSKLTSGSQETKVQKLIEEFMPKNPPYETIFGKNGEKTDVNVVIHGGDDTFKHGSWKTLASENGATIKKIPGGKSFEMTWKVTPDDPTGRLKPVTYHIKVLDEASWGYEDLRVFEEMNNADIPIEAYSYHSQYGRALRESTNFAPASNTHKVFLLGSCKGQVFRSRTARAFPNANLISTIDSEYFSDMGKSQMKFLKEFANRASWAQIRGQMDYAGAGLLHTDNYQFPDDRRQLSYLDTDIDGIPDRFDTVMNYGMKEPSKSGSWTPKPPVAANCNLSGDRLSFAVPVANGIIGYSTMAKSLEGQFVANGYGTYDPQGPVLTFEKGKDAAGKDVWLTKQNPAYSHLNDNAIVAAALAEMTLKGLASKHSDGVPTYEDRVVAFAQGAEIIDTWEAESLWDGYQKKYGFAKKLTLAQVVKKMDHDNGVTRVTVDDVTKKLGPQS